MTTKQFTVTTFPTLTAKQGTETEATWSELVRSLKDDVTYISKEACPLFKLGHYEGGNRKRGSPLHRVDAVMGDYDAGEVSVAKAAQLLQRAGVKAVLYTSASHTPEAPRWRVIAALSEPTTDELVFHAQMDVLNGALGGVLASESWDWRRNYFRGRVGGRSYEVLESEGLPLDDLIAFDQAPDPIPPASRPKLAAAAPVVLGGEDPVAQWLVDHGWALGRQDDKLYVRCPLADQHSAPQEDGDTSSAWLAPTVEHPHGSYSCRHTTHGTIGRTDFLRGVGYLDAAAEFEAMGPETDPTPEEEASSCKFKALSLGEFHTRKSPGWWIKGVIPRAELVVIYGPPGSGKSFIALDMAMAIARGREWRGRRVAQGGVVYVAAEGAAGFRNRTSGYLLANGLEGVEPFRVVADAPSLLNMDWKELAIAAGQCGAIVIDTLAAATPGGDENSAETMTMVADRCRKLARATGATVFLVHHSGKDPSKGSRGHSSLLAACDAEFEVTKDGTCHLLRNTKQKDGEDGQRWAFTLKQVLIGFDEDEEEITSCVVVEAELPVARTGGRPLAPYAAAINEVIQEMAQAQTTGIEVKGIRDEVKSRNPGADHSHFSRILKGLCSQLGYQVEGDSLSVGEV